MLFAVEGGGFLSSSASGYSSGLSLLLFGQKNEDRNIKVSPLNQYQLVHQGVDHFQISSRESHVPQGCSSFTCFGCVSSCDDDRSLHPTSDPPSNHSENSTESSSDKSKVTISVSVDDNERNIWLKSSLKKPSTNCCVLCQDDAAGSSFEEVQSTTSCFIGRRKVQWSDSCGKELTEIREFELSDDGNSYDELELKWARSCECVIQ
ncbi:hypothetical protein KSP40_PGU000931 [Platanthera guangdongensis]|uniref:Uncharacterized protein n=1 Tax=Platanthera guangdongensis TaxID=2320717 RepID=A0ABR2MEH3_9ASPA